jgi:hypothetical protein
MSNTLKNVYQAEHPFYPKADWLNAIQAGETEAGYWEWVESQRTDSFAAKDLKKFRVHWTTEVEAVDEVHATHAVLGLFNANAKSHFFEVTPASTEKPELGRVIMFSRPAEQATEAAAEALVAEV